MIPNLGDWLNQDAQWDEVIASLPKGELRDFFIAVQDGKIRVAVKPQNVDRLPKRITGTVADLLKQVDERNLLEETAQSLGIDHLMDRTVQQLSGGELQRMAIAATILQDVDVYFFDEPSSYLDIHERMRIVRIIQSMAETMAVIVIEHDLAVLDVLADLVHIVYRKERAFGIFTPARSTRRAHQLLPRRFSPRGKRAHTGQANQIPEASSSFSRNRYARCVVGRIGKAIGEFKLTSGEEPFTAPKSSVLSVGTEPASPR